MLGMAIISGLGTFYCYCAWQAGKRTDRKDHLALVAARGATMDFSQAGHRVIEGDSKEKILLLQPPNLGKTSLAGLTYRCVPAGSIAVVDEMGDNVLDAM